MDRQGNDQSGGLSVNAAVFVPRNYAPPIGTAPIQGLPTYMTSCFPFVQPDFTGNRPSGNYGNWPRNSRPRFGNRNPSGFHGNRPPAPSKFPQSPIFPFTSPPPPPPNSFFNPFIPPPNNVFIGNLTSLPVMPSEADFNVGINQVESAVEINTNNNNFTFNKRQRRKQKDKNSNDKIGRSNENINSQKENNSQRQRKRTNSGRKGGNTPRSTVLILCERELQTDFPESFSNKTLVQYPSPLYKSSSHIHNTKHDHDSDSGYSSPLHRKNQVCNGTQSETIQPWVMTPNTIQSDDPSIVHAASVPQQKFSYAFIAQKEPSPKPVIHVDNQKSANQETHRQKSANRNTVNRENSNFKSRKDKFSGNRSHGLTDNKQTKVNTHGSNNPQINSKIGFNDKLQGELQSKQYQMRKPGQKHLSDLDETKKGVNSNQNLAHQNDSDYGFSRTKNLNIEKHGEWRGKNESNLLKNISRSDKTNQFERQNQNGDDAGDPGKKKRKRRRRRKKKSKDGEPEDVDSNEEEELVPKPEVELHFEDVEEFPDLSSAKASENSSSGVGLSYSAILQTVPVRRPVFTEHIKTSSSEESPRKDNSDVKGTRASRRRRKRKDILNKEAENELAEIGLEQQMLKDQCLKTTKSTKDDKGQVPGILKVNPKNQPSGKKSKQNVSLDLGAVIDALEQKKTTISLTSVPRKEPKQKPDVLKKKETQKSKGSHNVLDSNAPVKRGKERETPKTKKPSPLKKVILKEREEKKHLRMLEGPESVATEAPVGIGVVSAESDLSQDAMSTKSSVDYTGTPGSANLSPISQTSPISMSPLSPGTSPLSSEVNSPIAGAVGKDVIRKIHSRRFREYCNQVLDKDIDDCATVLLQDLVRFQDRMYHKDPSKAKLKRRIVLGLREVTKHLKLKKIKCVIISPNLEKIQSKGGLDDALNNILHLCNEQNVPFVFALGRRALGRACAKLVPVSVAGIFNYSGSEENFRRLINLTEKARESYGEMVDAIEKEIKEYPTKIQPPTIPHVFAHMGHSRTPSGASVLSFTSSILSEPISENYPHSEPETDSKGYEIVKDDELLKQGLPTDSSGYHTQMRIIHSNTKCNVDDGNEADNEEEGVKINKNSFRTSEENLSMDSSDMVSALPHIDSIHSSTYDLNNEILSQHSGRTLENCEAMSTHSSRTIGDGSSTLLADMAGERSKHGTPKSTESPSNTLQRGMVVDEERIQNWVDETSSRLENLGLDEESYEDSTDDMSSDDESIESDDRDFEILKKDFKKGDSYTAFNDSQGSSRVTSVEHGDKMKSGANCDGKSTENADCSTEGANLKAQDCESKSKSNIKDETAGSRSTLKNENQSLISNCNSNEKPEGAEKRAAGQEKTPTEETNSYLTNLLTNIDCDTNNKICDTKSDNLCETDLEHVEIHID